MTMQQDHMNETLLKLYCQLYVYPFPLEQEENLQLLKKKYIEIDSRARGSNLKCNENSVSSFAKAYNVHCTNVRE